MGDNKKCNKQCQMCENRDSKTNFCKYHNVDCSVVKTDFSTEKCDGYLLNEKLFLY